MRETIFQGIMTKLRTLDKFKGSDGTHRVYDYPENQPSGYPYAVVSSGSFESSVLDNARDTRLYNYLIQVVGEKFGEGASISQSEALQAMRITEDAVVALLDGDSNLSIPSVTRTRPVNADYGTADGGTRIVLTITIQAETQALITN